MADEENEKKGSKGKLIAIVGILVLLLAGGGFFFLKSGAPAKGAEQSAESEEARGKDDDQSEGGTILELEPFIVNLADAGELRYLKATIKLDLLQPKYVDTINNRMPQIRDAILILLSSKDSKSIRTTEGKMELRDEIVQRVNGVFEDNKVMTIYFTDFVTQ